MVAAVIPRAVGLTLRHWLSGVWVQEYQLLSCIAYEPVSMVGAAPNSPHTLRQLKEPLEVRTELVSESITSICYIAHRQLSIHAPVNDLPVTNWQLLVCV
mgnify:CR=1 FL=1